MEDLMMFLILAISGIIGYRLMGRVDGFLNMHVADNEKSEREK